MLKSITVAVGLAVSLAACGSAATTSSPSAPSQPTGLTGNWSGSASDSTGSGTMSWNLTQKDSGVAGTISVVSVDGTASGTLTGTLSGSTLNFSISLGAAANVATQCKSSATGSADTSATQITGTYSGSGSCVGNITSGTFSLSKSLASAAMPEQNSVRTGNPSALEAIRAFNALPKVIGAGSWEPLGPKQILYGRGGTPSVGASFQSQPKLLGVGQVSAIGRVVAVAPHPTDANTIYVAAETGGVWKSQDAGITWRPLTDDQCTLRMTDLALDPVNPNIIYAATRTCGILRSVNAGDSWDNFHLAGTFDQAINRIVIDPLTAGSTHGTVIYAAVAQFGLFRSNDSALTFTNVLQANSTTSLEIQDIALDPANSLTVYAAARVGVSPFSSFTYSVFKSVNGGSSWTSSSVTTGQPTYNLHMSVAGSDPKTLYVSVPAATYASASMFKSVDAGQTWLATTSPEPSRDPSNGGVDVVAADPTDPKTVYYGGLNLHRSTDGGQTWGATAVNVHVDYHNIQFDRAGRIWVANDGGVWRSTDKSLTWAPVNNGLAVTQFYPGIGVSPDLSVIYGGTQDNGVLAYVGGAAWREVQSGDGGSLVIDPVDPGTIYVTQVANLLLSKCTSAGCSTASTGITFTDSNPILQASRSGAQVTLYYKQSGHIYRSTDLARTWALTKTAPPTDYILQISVPTDNPSVIYAGSFDSGVTSSRDGGDSWASLSLIPLSSPMTLLKVDPDNDHRVYAGMLGRSDALAGSLRRSNDGGATWTDLGVPGSLSPFSLISVVSQGVKTIFVGTDVGVLRSIDDGATWQNFSQGMPRVRVTDLAIASSAGVLVASTYGRGMFAISIR